MGASTGRASGFRNKRTSR